jgi:hypothetical protein
MPTPPAIPRLSALTLDAIRDATERYQNDGDTDRWERTVQQALARGHQAAYLLGIAERLGVDIDSGLITPRNMSRAERNELKGIVVEQIDYLERFIDVAGDLSDAQIQARADLYALGVKQTYWTGWAGEELECVPGGCEECYGNCRCALERQDDGVHWICSDDAHSCGACRERGATWPIGTVDDADVLQPGDLEDVPA